MPDSKKSNKEFLRITLVKSPIGYSKRQKGTVRALGLHRMNQTVEHENTPVIQGMVNKVCHLVEVEQQVEDSL